MDWEDLDERPHGDWYELNDSDTVIVFVHGLHSSKKRAWFFEGRTKQSKDVFWPDLVRSANSGIGKASIFLVNYYTGIDAGLYDIGHCVTSIFNQIEMKYGDINKSIFDFNRIIFVCHSMGGIIIRSILCKNWDKFTEKQVGLLLIASPSRGSEMANKFAYIESIFGHRQAQQLQSSSEFLAMLHKDFKDLINDKKIPLLTGKETCENKFYIKGKIPWFNKAVVVSEESAGQYFGRVEMIPDTDHASIAKPDSVKHQTHIILQQFWQKFEAQKPDLPQAQYTRLQSRIGEAKKISRNIEDFEKEINGGNS